jgi:hypothetical protein
MSQCLFIIKVSSPAPPVIPQFLGNADDFYRRVSQAFAALKAGSMFPSGFVALTAQQAAPTGWLVCDGTALGRSQFPDLFAKIGTIYGEGDGSTTFNIPTQAQCVPPAIAPTPPQVVTGGSVQPVTPPDVEVENPVGGFGGNQVVGGRPGDGFQIP